MVRKALISVTGQIVASGCVCEWYSDKSGGSELRFVLLFLELGSSGVMADEHNLCSCRMASSLCNVLYWVVGGI